MQVVLDQRLAVFQYGVDSTTVSNCTTNTHLYALKPLLKKQQSSAPFPNMHTASKSNSPMVFLNRKYLYRRSCTATKMKQTVLGSINKK